MNVFNKCLRLFVGLLVTTYVTLNVNYALAESKKPKTARDVGTSDGVGGNGFNRKMLESYVFHPEKSPAFTPKIAKILKTIFEDVETKDKGLSILKLKTWYLAPKSLKPIDKKILGVEFINGGIDQIAIQNDSEIWIDSGLFSAMTREEQSVLILHEVVMTYYLVKFMKFSELCRLMERAMEYNNCFDPTSATAEQADKLFPPEPLRDLVEKDYQNIRYLTNWLLKQGDKLTMQRFWKVARLSGFDQRFTKPEEESTAKASKAKDQSAGNSSAENSSSGTSSNGTSSSGTSSATDSSTASKDEFPERINLNAEEFMLKLNNAKYGNTLPKKCRSVDSNDTYDCEITWEVKEHVLNPIMNSSPTMKFLVITISESYTNRPIITASMQLNDEIGMYTATTFNGRPQKWYMFGTLAGDGSDIGQGYLFNMKNFQPGDRLVEVFFSFDLKQENVVRISLTPYVLAGKIKTIKDKGWNGEPIPKVECTTYSFARYRGETRYTSGAHVTESSELLGFLDYIKGLSQSTLKLEWDCNQVP